MIAMLIVLRCWQSIGFLMGGVAGRRQRIDDLRPAGPCAVMLLIQKSGNAQHEGWCLKKHVNQGDLESMIMAL